MHRGSWRYQRRERNEGACGLGCISWQPSGRDSVIRAVHFPTTGEERGRNDTVASQPQAGVSALPGRSDDDAVGGARDFEPERECRRRFPRERMKCGPWITHLTNWPAGENSAR
jgi:hypothetical protein